MDAVVETLIKFWESTGVANFTYQSGIMIVVSLFFLYLAIRHGFEPLLLVPIAFGMLLSNLPMTGIFLNDVVHEGVTNSNELADAGIFSIFYMLKPVLPSLIFLGVGAMTDFGPLIANPKSLLMGAAAQLGIFFAFFSAIALGFTAQEAGSIGIIG
ncbi:MAG: sodium ion-translocating decarboxylase subunit beta, partial [Bacillota bacterium]